ncbi:MAG: hypothetical protein HQK53_13800 [Oligoflexia bacterium]|nr:hypothetical protein [Oligoflexia bacterium]
MVTNTTRMSNKAGGSAGVGEIKIRIEGIYDTRTMQFLKRSGVEHYSFDMRPRSFNFLQQHRFFEIVERHFAADYYFYLRYEGEKDFVIKKMLDDIAEKGILSRESFLLEFSDNQQAEYYESLGHPFLWHYQEGDEAKLHELLPLVNFRGLVFSQRFFQEAHRLGRWYSLLNQLLSGMGVGPLGRDSARPTVVLTSDWNFSHNFYRLLNSPYFSDHVDQHDKHDKHDQHGQALGVDIFSLPIDSSVEVCYRNVDFYKLDHELKLVPKELVSTTYAPYSS